MKLEHEFTVPVPPEQAWAVLLDVPRIAPCMPGATVDSVDGDAFAGKVKVKVGPIQVTYGGIARIVERDDSARRAVIEATGKESRGAGTASMTVTAQLHDFDDGTRVTTVSDLSVTGRPAQFGRGVMADVGAKILDQFADCLAAELSAPASPPPNQQADMRPDPARTIDEAVLPDGAAPTPTARVPRETGVSSRPTPEAIDLLDVAGAPTLKRLAPVLGAIAALIIAVIVTLRVRRRSG